MLKSWWERTKSIFRRKRNEVFVTAMILLSSPFWHSWTVPSDVSWGTPTFYYFWDVSIPILTGARWNYSQLDLLPILSPLVIFLYLFSFVVLLFSRKWLMIGFLLAYSLLYSA